MTKKIVLYQKLFRNCFLQQIYILAMNLESISTTLIYHASQGDPDSRNRLMKLSEWVLFRIASRVLHNRQDVEDAVQETLTVVVKVMDEQDLRLEHGRQSFIRLLKTCLRNVAANQIRKKQVAPIGGSDNLNQIHNLIDDNIETVEEKRDIAEGLIQLAGLTENEKQVLSLYFLAGKLPREIAEETGLTSANVRQIQSRSLRKIRNFLGES